MEYGHLERVDHETRPTVYMGQINMPGVSGDLCLIPKSEKRSDKSPDYEVKLQRPGRDWTVVGAAWTKQFKDGSGDFHSITIDHPGLDKAIYVSSFPDDEDKQPKEADYPINFTIHWGRARRTDPAASDPVMSSDNIPY